MVLGIRQGTWIKTFEQFVLVFDALPKIGKKKTRKKRIFNQK